MENRTISTFQKNEVFCIASIAAQFILAGYTDLEALNKAGRLLESSKQYLDEQEYDEYLIKEREKDNKIKYTLEDIQNKLNLKGPQQIKRYIKEVFKGDKLELINKNIDKKQAAFSENDYGEIHYARYDAREKRKEKSGESKKNIGKKNLKK
jgi:hypothetical protein